MYNIAIWLKFAYILGGRKILVGEPFHMKQAHKAQLCQFSEFTH